MMMFFYDFITRLPHGFPLINSILANQQNFSLAARIFFPSSGIFSYTPSTLSRGSRVIVR
jgi:hypothetical protein